MELPDVVFGAASLALMGSALKLWRNDAVREKENSATARLAEKNATDLKHHEDECDRRHEVFTALSVKVDRMQQDIAQTQTTVEWIGRCTERIATKMSVDLPERRQ